MSCSSRGNHRWTGSDVRIYVASWKNCRDTCLGADEVRDEGTCRESSLAKSLMICLFTALELRVQDVGYLLTHRAKNTNHPSHELWV